MKILCISGSPSPLAWSRELMATVESILRTHDCEIDTIDLRTFTFPMLDTVAYGNGGEYPYPAGRDLRARVAEADGIVLGTSVFHSSFSGMLKNALDHLPAGAFDRKPVGLVANAGNQRAAAIACEQLRTVVKALKGWATPMQVASSADDFVAETRRPRPGNTVERCEAMCEQLLMFANALAATRTAP